MVLPQIERGTGAKFEYVPILLGGIFKATHNRSPLETLAGIKKKLECEKLELERFLRRHQITAFRRHGARRTGRAAQLRGRFYRDTIGI